MSVCVCVVVSVSVSVCVMAAVCDGEPSEVSALLFIHGGVIISCLCRYENKREKYLFMETVGLCESKADPR